MFGKRLNTRICRILRNMRLRGNYFIYLQDDLFEKRSSI